MYKFSLTAKFIAVTILVSASLIGLLLIRVNDIAWSLFWFYSVVMTVFLLMVNLVTRCYKPIPDRGYRPSVSIIIPAKNEEKVIQDTIKSILASNYPSEKMEVIVVNDGSTDKTLEKVKEVLETTRTLPMSVLDFESNHGKRVAFAAGVKHSKNDILICIDSDTLVDKDAIKFLVQPFTDENVVGVCGHGEAANFKENLLARFQHYWYQDMFRLFKGMESKFSAVSCCSGILAAYRKDSIKPVLEFWLQEKFLGRPIYIGDDRQLTNLVLWKGLTSMLLKSQGEDRTLTSIAIKSAKQAKVVYQSNAVAYTFVPTTFKQFMKQQLRWKRAWVHGTLLASQFMWRKKFPIPLIWYLYQFLTYFSPVVIITWLVVKPLQGEYLGTLGFIIGTLYIGLLQGLNLWAFGYKKESIIYRMLFVFISFFMSLTVLLYAWATPWKGGWVTRQQVEK